MIYATVQPMFFMNGPKDEDFEYLFLQLGSKINATASGNANFVGLGLGKIESWENVMHISFKPL